MRYLFFLLLSLLLPKMAFGQLTAQFYPIGEDPSLRGMSSYNGKEVILFEASPTVRFSFANTMVDPGRNENYRKAYYLATRPQFRMYTDDSSPVKTPSYRVFMGTQQMFRMPDWERSEREARFLSFSLESGHYSNGQSGCAFSKQFQDETDECDNVYTTINPDTNLSDLLNRETGNFSTNLTELILDYRTYRLTEEEVPKKMHAFQLGYVLYHNRFLFLADFGGFSDNDIEIYGRHRWLFAYELMDFWRWKQRKDFRFSFKQTVEIIATPHEYVNPFRFESMAAVYPIPQTPAFGFMISYIYGHDNYNYRFIDSGHQVSVGVTWSQFPPFPLTGAIGKIRR